jgi:hypothetical protein
VLVDAGSFPRGNRRTIGRLIKALSRLLRERPGEDATSRRDWL